MQEKALEFTIAKPERVLSRAMFVTELFSELQRMGLAPESLDAMLEITDYDRIPMQAVEYAQMKVSDHMGVADQAKKSFFFQNKTTSPTLNAMLRSIVRFSNHQQSTASNMSALLPALWNVDRGLDGKITRDGQRARDEAIENIVGTLVQNSLFHVMKLRVLVPILLSIGYMIGGDDDDEAMRKAQKKANAIFAPDKDSGFVMENLKGLALGKETEFFRSKGKTANATQASAYADLIAKMGNEWMPLVPVFGGGFGLYPVSSMWKSAVTNKVTQDAVAIATGLPSASHRYDKKGVYVYERDPSWMQNLMGMTAPTSVLYDTASAGKLSLDAAMTGDAEAFHIASYLVAQVLPFTRESRAYLKGKLQEPVWKENKKQEKKERARAN
jgi:hypothetical protein